MVKVITRRVCPCCKYVCQVDEYVKTVEGYGARVEKTIRKSFSEGTEDFAPVKVVGEYGNIVTIAVECPKCGVHINPEKCTTKARTEV